MKKKKKKKKRKKKLGNLGGRRGFYSRGGDKGGQLELSLGEEGEVGGGRGS